MSTTTAAAPATFSHNTMTRAAFRSHVAKVLGRYQRGLVLAGGYDLVEYLNAPQGLIVLAHRATAAQVDGIYPNALTKHVQHWANIIEPLEGMYAGYAVHYLTRRQQGPLVLGAFGRMIDAGAPEAPHFHRTNGYYALQIVNGPNGPIVAVVEDDEHVHVIEGGGVASNPAHPMGEEEPRAA